MPDFISKTLNNSLFGLVVVTFLFGMYHTGRLIWDWIKFGINSVRNRRKK